jgi:GntR family transcriptional regulator/MocR family aminotransferase
MPSKSLSAIVLNRGKRASLQRQLAVALKDAIRRGSVRPGEAIPSSRELATDLKISRNTVLIAYDELVSEGYLDARPRSGLFVAQALAGQTGAAMRAKHASGPFGALLAAPVRLSGPEPFRPCQPDVRLFPLGAWNRSRGRALKVHGSAILNYQSHHPFGLPALRRVLADYLRDNRGVRCHWEQVAITSGSQQALYLLSHLLLKPNGHAFIEDPGYLGARFAFLSTGATVTPVPVDDEGIIPPDRLAPASVIYVTPSRQFPTGSSLPVARRLALISLAHANSAWIVEDDYDSEFRYRRAPLPSLRSLDTFGRVIYTGSMSKILFPSLRIGYVVLPDSMVDDFARLRTVVDEQGALVDQAALAEFIGKGSFFGHIRRCRKEYSARLDTFLTTAAHLKLPLRFPNPEGGMDLLGDWILPPQNEAALYRRLLEAGFYIPSLSQYSIRSTRRGLVFGFTAFDHATIKSALQRLATIIR